jgi:ATP-binding cassette subfamily B protein
VTATVAESSANRAGADTDGVGNVDPAAKSVLPELRNTLWEAGVHARASAGVLAVLGELPRLLRQALAISWRTDRVRTAIVAVTIIGTGVLTTFGLLATQQILIQLFEAGPTPSRVVAALPALAYLAVLIALRGSLGVAVAYAENGLTLRVGREVKRRLFEVTTAVKLDSFDQEAFADDMERASRGTEAAVELVRATLWLVAGVVGLVAVMAAVVVINPWLLVALVMATLPNAWAALAIGNLRYRTYLAGSVRRRRLWILHNLMAERWSAAELRGYGLRGFLLDQYDRIMGAETEVHLRLGRHTTTMSTVGAAIAGVGSFGVYALLGVLLYKGVIPLSEAATCVIALQAAQRSLYNVMHIVDGLYTEGRYFADYTGFLDRARDYLPPAPGTTAAGSLRSLGLQNVSFTYPGRDTPAVRDLSLRVDFGQTVAFVGENGSGKSTVAAMIAGLRQPGEGVIAWNGRTLADYEPASLRARITIAAQDHCRWPFTAATNIALGNLSRDGQRGFTEPPREQIEAAATQAVAHDMIQELPHGYETMLDRRFAKGQDLSGGQWQRIAAARGFLRDADLLIMDEPSSALDAHAEHALFQTIRDRRGVKTTVLITHRLANVRHADVIYVLDRGQLVESGSHEELIASGGRYAEMFAIQAAGYHEPE